jgi:hypothetical protein
MGDMGEFYRDWGAAKAVQRAERLREARASGASLVTHRCRTKIKLVADHWAVVMGNERFETGYILWQAARFVKFYSRTGLKC